jgi:hypothetical protein
MASAWPVRLIAGKNQWPGADNPYLFLEELLLTEYCRTLIMDFIFLSPFREDFQLGRINRSIRATRRNHGRRRITIRVFREDLNSRGLFIDRRSHVENIRCGALLLNHERNKLYELQI